MTLSLLLFITAAIALILTIIQSAAGKIVKNLIISFLQNFTGALFVFSGFVKAVDPLGTAFKMEQYFAEFESTFAGTKAAFLAPIFPTLAEYAIAFSVFMVVFEILLGVMLLIGAARKFTAWAFFLLVLFFTFLTGFTYLTGYVPEGVNFFSFGEWGKYVATSMKVTDCGCFGDFLVLDPKVSFMKDVFLLIPAILFLFTTRSFHELDKANDRALAVGLPILVSLAIVQFYGYSIGVGAFLMALGLIGAQYLGMNFGLAASGFVLLIYCFSNYVWDIPKTDFRPFHIGSNIAERKAAEEEAENDVEILAYEMTNKETGEVVQLAFDQYMTEYQKYPSEEWELEQIKSEPAIKRTKISDFEASDLAGSDVTYDILSHEGYSVMIVAYKMYFDEEQTTTIQRDSIFTADTIVNETGFELVPRFVEVKETEVSKTTYTWEEDYVAKWNSGVHAFAEAAKAAGLKTYVITAYAGPEQIQSFQQKLGATYDFYTADDILLKTIVRSNPGVVLMKNGTVMNKWHYKRLPAFGSLELE